MKSLNLKNLLFNLLMALFIGVGVQMVTGINAYAAAGTVFVTGAVAAPYLKTFAEGTLMFMAVQKQIWQNHIEEEIFKDNSFLNYCHRADDNVLNGSVVHIPQSGGSGNVVKNRKNLPANVRKRDDSDIVYPLDEFTSDPVVIPDIDNAELSYDKRNSVLGEDRDNIVQNVAEWMLYNWVVTPATLTYSADALPSAKKFLTTGSNRAATAPGATGTRKKATLTDLQTIKTALQKENKWKEGKMYGLLTPEMEADLFPPDSAVTAQYMMAVSKEERELGVQYKVQGFKLMVRSTVLIMDNSNDFKQPGEASATTDDEASLFWYSESLECAMGEVKMFEAIGEPTMYGDVYSFLVRSGGRARRSDYAGVAVLQQDAGA